MTQPIPRIAVLLAAHNGALWLEKQLASILNQEQVVLTVFVSVDRSKDGTEALVDSLVEANLRVVALPHGREFGGAAPNFFRLLADVDFAAFDYVAFADQDDIWFPNKLSRATNQLNTLGADAYSSNVTAFWPDGSEMLIVKSQSQRRWDFLFEAAGPGCTYVFSKDLAIAIQSLIKQKPDKFSKIGLHDWFVYAYARSNGYKWIIDDFSGLKYRQHNLNQVGVNKGIFAFVQRAKRILNGWAFKQTELIVELNNLGNETFVKNYLQPTRFSRLKLALQAKLCRRRGRDQLMFVASCLTTAVIGGLIK